MAEGIPPALVVPTGYTNATTAFFYPRPEITNITTTLAQVYVSPQGSDDVTNVGANTSPFATISAALFYVTNVLDQPLTAPVCIFVAPGTYEGGFTVPDKVYLIGPSNSPEPVIITGNVFALSATSDSIIGLQNITFQGVTVAGAFYDVNLEMSNCKIQTDTVFSALTIAQDDPVVNASVYATECMFVATDAANVAVISGNTSEKTSLILDNCQLVTAGAEGSLIDMTGSLTVRNCSLLSTATGATLAPLILLQSGATLTPVVSLEGSVLKYSDITTTDTGGNKLAIRFDAPTQPITASMTNCTVSIFLGGGATDIVKNIGAVAVTLRQSANSCLLDGKDINTTNITLPAVSFLNGGGGGGGGTVYQATYYKSVQQNLTNGTTDMTFDEEGTWNNDNGYITHTGGTADFTVVQAGLYQLEFNATVIANGATWTASLLKQISIDITRSPTPEIVSIAQNASISSGSNYGQNACSTYNLEAGDVINCRVSNNFATATPYAQGVTNTFDLNTWFSWRYVAAGGASPAVGVVSIAGVDGVVTLSSPGGAIGITPNGQDIELSNNGIFSLAGLTGLVTLSSPDASVNINVSGSDIELQAVIPVAPVDSVGGKTGTVTFSAGTGISLDYGANNADPITIAVLNESPPVVVQAAGTTALTSTNNNTIFILTSGTTQDFTTLTLDTPQAGHVWYVKNAKASGDVTVEWNAQPIVGFATLHARTGSTNSSMQILYWDGADLFIY